MEKWARCDAWFLVKGKCLRTHNNAPCFGHKLDLHIVLIVGMYSVSISFLIHISYLFWTVFFISFFNLFWNKMNNLINAETKNFGIPAVTIFLFIFSTFSPCQTKVGVANLSGRLPNYFFLHFNKQNKKRSKWRMSMFLFGFPAKNYPFPVI